MMVDPINDLIGRIHLLYPVNKSRLRGTRTLRILTPLLQNNRVVHVLRTHFFCPKSELGASRLLGAAFPTKL
jgi:hypothetical protein